MAGEAVITAMLDDKATAILAAATDVFARYGYRRASMEDIARAAGMSRAALYLHFKNKEDIFTSLVKHYFANAAHDVAAALRQGGTPIETLKRAFKAKTGPTFRSMLESPHGAELLTAKSAIAPDVVQSCEDMLSGVFMDWLSNEAQTGRIDLGFVDGDAQAMTHMILAAMDGVVMSDMDVSSLPKRLDGLAEVFGRALTPR